MSTPVTTLGQPYDFPRPPLGTPSSTSVLNDFPVYVSPDCQPMNRFYQVIEGSSEAFGRRDSVFNIFKHENFSLLFRRATSLQLALPPPKFYTDQEQYQSALEEWFQDMRRYFAAAMLPQPVAGIFRLPELPKIFKKDEKMNPGRFRTFKAAQWPLLPNNYLDMLDVILEKEPINPDEQFKEQVPKRDVIYYKHHMTQDEQWMSQVVPSEPLPFMYNSFEEFVVAYKMWAHITFRYIQIPVMKVREFTKIAAMDVVEQSTEGPRPVLQTPKEFTEKMDLSWAPPNVYFPERIQANLGRLWQEVVKPRTFKIPEGSIRAIEVFGVSKKVMLDEMMKFGTAIKVRPPRNFYCGKPIRGVESLRGLIEQAKSYDMNLVLRILQYDLTLGMFERLMKVPVNSVPLATLISRAISEPNALRYLSKRSQVSENHKCRTALLLYSLLRNEPNTTLVRVLCAPGNLSIFEWALRLLNLASGAGVCIVPSIKGIAQWKGFEIITMAYYLSVFLRIMSRRSGMKYYQDCLGMNRHVVRDLYKVLSAKENLTRLREAPEGTDLYYATLMMLGTNSQQIHKLLLGKDYLVWINQGPVRPGLNSVICHTSVIFAASQLLFEALTENVLGPLETLIENLNPSSAILLAHVVKRMIGHFGKCGCRITGKTVLPLLQAVAVSRRECIAAVLGPLADLVSSNAIISDLGAPDFQPLLVKTVCNICRLMNDCSGLELRQKIQALTKLARDENCCFAMLQVPGFKPTLISQLTSKDAVLATRAWELFEKMVAYKRVAVEMFAEGSRDALGSIIDDKMDRVPLKRFIELIRRMWKEQDSTITMLLVNILQSRIGSLVCILKTRYVKYRHDEAMIRSLERFYGAMIRLNVDGNFLNQLADHMTEQRKMRSRTQTMKSLRSQASIRPPDLNSLLG